MKSTLTLLVLIAFGGPLALGGQLSSLGAAFQAQAILGNDLWSQVIKIENTGETTRYPRVVHALIFELAGILWFYTDTEGTQSLSTHRGCVEQDKCNFGLLLREIHAGFSTWEIIPAPPPRLHPGNAPLPNGCFIESVANLRQRLLRGEMAVHPRLLSYYIKSRRAGHTVLVFESNRGVRVVDPDFSSTSFRFPRAMAGDARAISRALLGRSADKANWVSIDEFAARMTARRASTNQESSDPGLPRSG